MNLSDLFNWYRPKAGPIAFPTLLKGRIDPFCADLVEKAGVLLLPGTVYGQGLNSFRVGFGRKNLPDFHQPVMTIAHHDMVTLHEEYTVQQALNHIRSHGFGDKIVYFPVRLQLRSRMLSDD